MNIELIEQMMQVNSLAEQHKTYMLENSHSLGESGQAMYWLCMLDKTIEILYHMECPEKEILRAVTNTLTRSQPK